MEIVLPIKLMKKSNTSADIDGNLIPVNNFFCRWFTDIDIKRYPDDLRILTDKTIEIHDYAEGQLKYLPKDSLKKLESLFFTQVTRFIFQEPMIEGTIMQLQKH